MTDQEMRQILDDPLIKAFSYHLLQAVRDLGLFREIASTYYEDKLIVNFSRLLLQYHAHLRKENDSLRKLLTNAYANTVKSE